MRRGVNIVVLVLVLWALSGAAALAGALLDGYFRYPPGRLMFKLPPGNWQVVEQAPASFSRLVAGTMPTAILSAPEQGALILIWVKHTYTDYSHEPVQAFAQLKSLLQERQKAADDNSHFKYFEYQLQDGPIKAKSVLEAKTASFPVRGVGEALFFFREGDSYFYYAELLARAQEFEAASKGFLEAMGETYAY
jgi:hypothetical protein